jgi:hypothetical protein
LSWFAKRVQVEADEVLRELKRIGFVNMMDFIRIGENGEPFVDLSSLDRGKVAGLLHFKYREYKDGRGEDARDVCEVEIRLNPAKFNALVKLGEHIGLFKPDQAKDAEIEAERQKIADESLRVDRLTEIAARFAPEALPEPYKPAKKKVQH